MQSATKKPSLIGNGHIIALLLLTLLASAGCREKPQDPPLPESESAKLFETQRAALEKAKAVQAQADQLAAKQAEALKQQEEQSSP